MSRVLPRHTQSRSNRKRKGGTPTAADKAADAADVAAIASLKAVKKQKAQ